MTGGVGAGHANCWYLFISDKCSGGAGARGAASGIVGGGPTLIGGAGAGISGIPAAGAGNGGKFTPFKASRVSRNVGIFLLMGVPSDSCYSPVGSQSTRYKPTARRRRHSLAPFPPASLAVSC